MSIIYNNKTISGRGKDGKDGAGYQIGDIGYALYVDETKGTRRRLNGSVLAKNTNTQQFFDYLIGLQTSAPSLFTTEENWQSEITLSKLGQCGKFVLSENEVRLPKVVNINGLQDLAQAGVRVDESLPNITGQYAYDSDCSSALNASTITSGAYTTKPSLAPNKINGVNYRSNTRGMDIAIDASLSSSTYQDGAPVQEEAIQYPFFIQIAATSEVTLPITNTLELNNAYSFGDSKYLDIELNNISWLKSEGQWISKAIYPDYFNWVLTNATNGVDRFKFSTDEYNDYDWVVNSGNETFRLPLKSYLAGGKAVVGNGLTLGLTNGVYNGALTTSYPEIIATAQMVQGSGYGINVTTTAPAYNTSIFGSFGVTTDGTKSGIETDTTGLYLYFYVGETVQNANLIDAGRIQEQFAGLRTVVEVSDKSLLPSWYRVYSDGWCEQGGYLINSGTVSFLKPYKDENYNILIGIHSNFNGAPWGTYMGYNAKTYSGFTHSTDGNSPKHWQASGYIR